MQQTVCLLSGNVDVDVFDCARRAPPREDSPQLGARSGDGYVHGVGSRLQETRPQFLPYHRALWLADAMVNEGRNTGTKVIGKFFRTLKKNNAAKAGSRLTNENSTIPPWCVAAD